HWTDRLDADLDLKNGLGDGSEWSHYLLPTLCNCAYQGNDAIKVEARPYFADFIEQLLSIQGWEGNILIQQDLNVIQRNPKIVKGNRLLRGFAVHSPLLQCFDHPCGQVGKQVTELSAADAQIFLNKIKQLAKQLYNFVCGELLQQLEQCLKHRRNHACNVSGKAVNQQIHRLNKRLEQSTNLPIAKAHGLLKSGNGIYHELGGFFAHQLQCRQSHCRIFQKRLGKGHQHVARRDRRRRSRERLGTN